MADHARPGVLPTLRKRLYGVVFLAVLGSLVALSVASYQKTFVDVVPVSLQTDRAGNQLNELADVKLRGMRVGEVREVRSDGRQATIEMALAPEHVGQIPANVRARLIPKTLFGEKYVQLVIPGQPAAQAIQSGDVIPQDRSQTAIELEKVFDDVLPMLRAVQPEDLNATLYAMATALEGRGDKIGENFERVDAYFTRFNPELETFKSDISGLADLADTYEAAAPDLARLLRAQAATSRTLVAKDEVLAQFFAGTQGFAQTTESVLAENESRLIQLSSSSRPVLEMFARYSPVYPCFLDGLARYDRRLSGAFGRGYQGLHITLEIIHGRPGYKPGVDDPAYGDSSGPNCHGMPNPPNPQPGADFDDGSSTYGEPDSESPFAAFGAASVFSPVGTQAEHEQIAPLLAASAGMRVGEVPDLATLMFAPMARGATVNVS